MFNYCLIFTTLLCTTHSQEPQGDLNNKWRLNDLLVKHINHFYHHFAITVEDADDPAMRFSSIVSLAMSIYASSNITDPNERVTDAVDQTRRRLYQPADVISALMRSRLMVFQTVLEPPIIDAQISCPPEKKQTECLTALKKIHNENERKCPGYKKHVEFYEKVIDKRTSGLRQDFLDTFEAASSAGDDDETALEFFVDIATVKFPAQFAYISQVYQDLTNEIYPCVDLPLLSF